MTHATILEWEQRTKISFFKKYLNKKLHKLLLTNVNPAETFTEYISVAIIPDNNLLAHKQPRYITSRTNDGRFSQTTTSTRTGSHSGPIDLTATRRTNYQTKFTSQKRGPISGFEKQRRLNNNLCIYCGNPGHWATACPHKKNKTSNRTPTKSATAEMEQTEKVDSNATIEEVLYVSKNQ